MTPTPERAEQILARMLRCQDESREQVELRIDVARQVAALCGPTLTLRLASVIMLAVTLDGIDISRVTSSSLPPVGRRETA